MYARFGQELYLSETLEAARVTVDRHERDDDSRMLSACIAELLPHPSAATRSRVAAKLLQRITAGSSLCEPPDEVPASVPDSSETRLRRSPSAAFTVRLPGSTILFARLMSGLPDAHAQRELVYYAAAQGDCLIGAIAREVLYPYFIEDRIPAPFTEDEFIMANAGLLLAPEPILTAGFVADFARRAWSFDSERTVCLALRILRQAGILIASPLLGARGRVAAYTLAPHSLSLPALLWSLHAEFGREPMAPAWDQVVRSACARLFVVPPSIITSRLWEAEKAGIVSSWSLNGTRRMAFKVRAPEALAHLLLTGPLKK